MTKNQIIAKAMLTTLGIYASVTFALGLRCNPSIVENTWILPLSCFITATAIFFVALILVFNNDFLVFKMIGPQETEEDFDQYNYLIKTFRVSFVILALLFFCSSGTLFGLTKFLQAFSLSNIRVWITDVIETKRITGNLTLTRYTSIYITTFIKLVIIAYLLLGAPHVIRWHLKNSCLNKKAKGEQNE